MPSHPTSSPQWKQEVNRRLAAHRSRRQPQTEDEDLFQTKAHASGRAAQAAARVAARYASAPSFAALDAALAADMQPELPFAAPLPGTPKRPGAPKFMSDPKAPAIPARRNAAEPKALAAPAMKPSAPVVEPLQKQAPAVVAVAAPKAAIVEAAPAADFVASPSSDFALTPQALEPLADPKKKSHVRRALFESESPAEDNLLFFPCEPAPRPRTHAQESAFIVSGASALSIFEVDPVVDAAPVAAAVAPAPAPAVDFFAAPEPETIAEAPASWTAPVEEPLRLPSVSRISGVRLDLDEAIELEPDPAPGVARICAAPLQRRLMALTVDASLIALAFVVAAGMAASHMETLPSLHAMKTIAAVALAVIGLLYLAFFAAVAEATPGMCYAGLKLRQHNHRKASRAQRLWRIPALLLALAPLGLGMLWPFFDKNHLSLRDRLTRTYLWKR